MVACLKANGKVLREFKDTVYVPFGSEYSILIKNLNSVRAIVDITIDGTDAVPGGLVVNSNEEIDLERFVKDMSQGNKFKFIERTSQIEDGPRGIKAEDGLIRISFKYEVPRQVFYNNTIMRGQIFGNNSGQWPSASGSTGGMVYDSFTNISQCNASVTNDINLKKMFTANQVSASSAQLSATAQSDVGITVPGSLSSQKFTTVSSFQTETEEHVMVLRLAGDLGQNKVTKPVTVKAKPKCVTCGKQNKATAKFCTECGTALEIFV